MNKAENTFLHEFNEESVPVPLRSADRRGRFRSFNRAWLVFTGRSEVEESSDGWLTRVHPQDIAALSDAIAHGVVRQQTFDVRYRLLRHDGSYRWMLDHFTPHLDGKEWLGWLSASSDVTDLVGGSKLAAGPSNPSNPPNMQATSGNEQSGAKALAGTCEQIFSAIAHDLRNPMNGVQSWAHVLESAVPDPSPIVERATQGIKASIKRQVKLVDDLLNAMAVVSGQVELHNDRVALNQCVHAGVAKAQSLLDEKKLQVHLELSPSEVFVQGDVVRLEQIVAGLLANAAKFSPNATEIMITTSREKSQARLQIHDHGTNMSTEASAVADFTNPFHQSRNSDGARSGGWNVAMARELIELHGGQFTVNNRNAKGIEFVVTLPALD